MLFGKKKYIDLVIKYFNDKKISYEKNDNNISFEAAFDDYSVFPYITIDEDLNLLTCIINIRKISQKENVLLALNEFNLNSTFFKAMLKNDVILLEYNSYIDNSIIENLLKLIIDTISSLKEEIKVL